MYDVCSLSNVCNQQISNLLSFYLDNYFQNILQLEFHFQPYSEVNQADLAN